MPTGDIPVDFISRATQTHVIDVSSQCIQIVSEEGSSHLTDDGWAETQSQIVEIRDFVVNLRSGDGQVFHEHVKSQDIEEREGPRINV